MGRSQVQILPTEILLSVYLSGREAGVLTRTVGGSSPFTDHFWKADRNSDQQSDGTATLFQGASLRLRNRDYVSVFHFFRLRTSVGRGAGVLTRKVVGSSPAAGTIIYAQKK